MGYFVTYIAKCGINRNNNYYPIKITIGFKNYEEYFNFSNYSIDHIFDKALHRMYGKIFNRITNLSIESIGNNYSGKTADIYI